MEIILDLIVRVPEFYRTFPICAHYEYISFESPEKFKLILPSIQNDLSGL